MRLKALIFNNPRYPFRHWFTTLALAPIIYFIVTTVGTPGSFSIDLFGLYILFLIFGFFLSFPTFFVYYFLYLILSRKGISPVTIKIILDIEAIFGMFVTFKLMNGDMIHDLYLPYFIAIILSSLLYKTDKFMTVDS